MQFFTYFFEFVLTIWNLGKTLPCQPLNLLDIFWELSKKMRFSENLIRKLTKVVIATVCFINILLLWIDLRQLIQLLHPQLWVAVVLNAIMLFLNAFLMVGIFTYFELPMIAWLFSYLILILVSAVFILNGEFPFFLPIPGQVLTFSHKTEQLPICQMVLAFFSHLTVMAGYAVLSFFTTSQQQILPMRYFAQNSLGLTVRTSPEIQSSQPPPYSAAQVPAYREAIL